jgi:large subunit ribosomal protein L25
MSHETYELKAEAREQVGKGSAREVRRRRQECLQSSMATSSLPWLSRCRYKDIYYKIHGGGFLTTLATIDVGGKKIQVLPKDYQLDPVSDFSRFMSTSCVSGKDIRSLPLRCRSTSSTRKSRPASSAAACSTSCATRLSSTVPANAIPEFITVDLDRHRNRRLDAHFGRQAAGGRHPGDQGPRFHHRDNRRFLGIEVGSDEATLAPKRQLRLQPRLRRPRRINPSLHRGELRC